MVVFVYMDCIFGGKDVEWSEFQVFNRIDLPTILPISFNESVCVGLSDFKAIEQRIDWDEIVGVRLDCFETILGEL